MKKLILGMAVLSLVSCGKHELIGKAEKELNDFKGVVSKAVHDTVDTGAKAIDDTVTEVAKDTASVITGANDIKNEVLTRSGDFTEDVGDGIEAIGQAPRDLVNAALGIDADSDEDLKDLEDEVAAMYEELKADIEDTNQSVVDAILALENSIQESSDTLQNSINNSAQSLQGTIATLQSDLEKAIRKGDRKNSRKLRQLQQRVRDFKSDLRQLERLVDGLEVECQRFRYTPFVSYCYLSQSRNR